MISELEDLNSGTQRTRRNIMKMGTILATAALGKVHWLLRNRLFVRFPFGVQSYAVAPLAPQAVVADTIVS